MGDSELVELIAESIYLHIRDDSSDIKIKDFVELTQSEKELYLSMAHDIVSIFDDFYDAELDDEEDDFEDEEEDIIDEW